MTYPQVLPKCWSLILIANCLKLLEAKSMKPPLGPVFCALSWINTLDLGLSLSLGSVLCSSGPFPSNCSLPLESPFSGLRHRVLEDKWLGVTLERETRARFKGTCGQLKSFNFILSTMKDHWFLFLLREVER